MVTAAVAKKAIGIPRVSSRPQEDKYGYEVQKADIEGRVAALGSTLVELWKFQESATDADNRPQFNEFLHRLVAMGQSGAIHQVIFGRPDRLGRDGAANFFYYIGLLEKTGGLEVRFGEYDVSQTTLTATKNCTRLPLRLKISPKNCEAGHSKAGGRKLARA